jgi:hypothetical protein
MRTAFALMERAAETNTCFRELRLQFHRRTIVRDRFVQTPDRGEGVGKVHLWFDEARIETNGIGKVWDRRVGTPFPGL